MFYAQESPLYIRETRAQPFDPLIHSLRMPVNPMAHFTDDELVGLVFHGAACGHCYWASRFYGWKNTQLSGADALGDQGKGDVNG